MEVLKLERVSRAFIEGETSFNVLVDIDFAINAGQVVVVTGCSGSGKSTLLHIMGLLEQPDSGVVRIEGRNCVALSDDELSTIRSNTLGFVYQFHHLLPEFSAIENLNIAQMIAGCDDECRAGALLAKFGLGTKILKYPSELSGGEKQRIAIARAMINNPKILLADEPTGNLDQENADLVFNMMLDIAKLQNLAVVIVTHNLELAKRADIVLLLEKGSLKVL